MHSRLILLIRVAFLDGTMSSDKSDSINERTPGAWTRLKINYMNNLGKWLILATISTHCRMTLAKCSVQYCVHHWTEYKTDIMQSVALIPSKPSNHVGLPDTCMQKNDYGLTPVD